MDETSLLAAAFPDVGALAGRRAAGRETAVVAGIRCVRRGLDTPWATTAYAMDPPSADGLAEALTWLRARSPSYDVVTRARHASAAVFTDAGLHATAELPAMVAGQPVGGPPARPSALPQTLWQSGGPVTGVEVREARTPAEFLVAYGEHLTPLILDADLADPDHVHLVAVLGGRVVGCALARHAAGTGYLSAVAVSPQARRRGIGAVLTTAAGRAAFDRGWRPVWLHATKDSAPLYTRLGYRLVDVHVELEPVPGG